VLFGAVHEWPALVFHHGNILQREGLDTGIGEATLGDPVDMVIVGLVVSRNAGARHQLGIHILAVLIGEQLLIRERVIAPAQPVEHQVLVVDGDAHVAGVAPGACGA
jgi:hypothetical protein